MRPARADRRRGALGWVGPRHAAALVGVLALMVAGLGGVRGGSTEASWTTAEYSNATISTATIQPPVLTSCVATSALGVNPTITVVWHFPTGSGYVTPTNVVYLYAPGGSPVNLTIGTLGTGIATTGPDASGNYTTVYSGALLSGLLGGSILVGVSSITQGWTSSSALALASMGLLGANPACTIQ